MSLAKAFPHHRQVRSLYLLASAGLHLALFVTLWIEPLKIETPQIQKQRVEVSIVTAAPKEELLLPPQTQKGKSRSRTVQRTKKGFNFAPTFQLGQRPSESTATESAEDEITSDDLNSGKQLSVLSPSAQLFADQTNSRFHRLIYNRIDSAFLFDDKLAHYSHYGRVVVQFTANPNGTLKPNSLIVWCDDSILKVHALRAIRKALLRPLETANLFSTTGTEVTFHSRFDFEHGDPSLNFEKQTLFAKPVLVFHRHTLTKPIPTNLKDQLLHGGVHYDLFKVAESWENYLKRKERQRHKFDPFYDYRTDPDYNL